MATPHIITDYPSLIRALASERKARGWSQVIFDDVVGLADGHTAKIEANVRNLSPLTLPLYLQAIGCILVLHPHKSVKRLPPPSPDQFRLPLDLPSKREILAANPTQSRPNQAQKVAK